MALRFVLLDYASNCGEFERILSILTLVVRLQPEENIKFYKLKFDFDHPQNQEELLLQLLHQF